MTQEPRAEAQPSPENNPWHAQIPMSLADRARDAVAEAPGPVRAMVESTIEARTANPEDSGALNQWLEWVASLPWAKLPADEPITMEKAARVLNAAHLGDDPVRQLLLDRILGSCLVSKTGSRHRGQPLLLVGPPGCGKTSLARSAARAMGRACVFVSVPTAARDGVYLLGCSRVYRGAEPGVIIKAVRSAGTSRVLLVLDELDKTFDGSGSTGPSAASCLLELLDGSHATWTDRYLEVPFDLSEVFFIATANSLESVPDALVDRWVVVELPGLSPAERVEVARAQIWPQLLAHYGLAKGLFPLDDDALRHLVLECARPGETGLRGVESRLEACLLRAATRGFDELWPVPITRGLIRVALAPLAPGSRTKRLGFAAPEPADRATSQVSRVQGPGFRGSGG
ncbi:MAG: AAA family ATPase [Candidatus Dormibacteria bacterium]